MATRPAASFVTILAMACGPSLVDEPTLTDPLVYETLAERCGSTDPILLLALAPNETMASGYSQYFPSPGSIQSTDRWMLRISTYDRDLTQTSFCDTSEDGPKPVSSRVVSVDRCGGDLQILPDYSTSVRAPKGTEPWSACGPGHTMIIFDPNVEGSEESYPELECTAYAVDGAFVTFTTEAPDQDLMFVRARLRLGEPAEITPLVSTWWPPQRVGDSDIFLARDLQLDLLEVNARTGQTRVLRSGVTGFKPTDDGRFVLWTPITGDSPAPWYLWDRQTDQERALGRSEWSGSWLDASLVGDVVSVSLLEQYPSSTQLILVPSGEELLVTGDWSGYARIGDTYILQRRHEDSTLSLALIEPGSDVPHPIPHGILHESWISGESLWTLGSDEVTSYGLLELAAPDFTPRVVATDVWYPQRLADGRLLTVLDRNANDRYGTLVLVDADGPVAEIDHDVLSTRTTMNPLIDDELLYMVRDPDHVRTGVWLAQIAPLVE